MSKALRFLRDLWLITKATLMHPLTPSDVNLDTGEITPVDWDSGPGLVFSSEALHRSDKLLQVIDRWIDQRAIEFAVKRGEKSKKGDIRIGVEDIDNAAAELMFIVDEGNLFGYRRCSE